MVKSFNLLQTVELLDGIIESCTQLKSSFSNSSRTKTAELSRIVRNLRYLRSVLLEECSHSEPNIPYKLEVVKLVFYACINFLLKILEISLSYKKSLFQQALVYI